MFKNTLISLAAIRTLSNSQKDYLDFLLPFVQEAALKVNNPFKCRDLVKYIYDNFGLSIPERTIELTIKKISKSGLINKNNKQFTYTPSTIQHNKISDKAEEAKVIINDVIFDIQKFAKERNYFDISEDDVIKAIIHFLSIFSVDCLKFYHQKTVLPIEKIEQEDWQIIMISAYITHLQKQGGSVLDKFMVVVYGHMLTTSLLCPDLQEASKSYKNVKFFFDTSNIIEALGLDGSLAQESTMMLFNQIRNLGGNICCFTHTIDEIKHVIYKSAQFINKDEGNSGVVHEARRKGLEAADLTIIADSIEKKIEELPIRIVTSPGYIKDFQICEETFSRYLDQSLRYKNANAKSLDINSIRCIFAIRKKERAVSIEKTKAIFVTKNSSFAKSACEYAYEVEKSSLSPAISSYTLASIAWLKSPMETPQLPAKEIIAFSYAALRPDTQFWVSVISQAEKLKESGEISSTQLQVIRASVEAKEYIYTTTLGEESSINKESIIEAADCVTKSIQDKANKESNVTIEKLKNEISIMQSQLDRRTESDKQKRENKINWCKKRANRITNSIYYTLLFLAIFMLVIIEQPNLNNAINYFDLKIENSFLQIMMDNLNKIIGALVLLTGLSFTKIKSFINQKVYEHILDGEQAKGDLDNSLIDGLPNKIINN